MIQSGRPNTPVDKHMRQSVVVVCQMTGSAQF